MEPQRLAFLALAVFGAFLIVVTVRRLVRVARQRSAQHHLDGTGLIATGQVVAVEPMQRALNNAAGHAVGLVFHDARGMLRHARDPSGLGGYLAREGMPATVRYSPTDLEMVRVEALTGRYGPYPVYPDGRPLPGSLGKLLFALGIGVFVCSLRLNTPTSSSGHATPGSALRRRGGPSSLVRAGGSTSERRRSSIGARWRVPAGGQAGGTGPLSRSCTGMPNSGWLVCSEGVLAEVVTHSSMRSRRCSTTECPLRRLPSHKSPRLVCRDDVLVQSAGWDQAAVRAGELIAATGEWVLSGLAEGEQGAKHLCARRRTRLALAETAATTAQAGRPEGNQYY